MSANIEKSKRAVKKGKLVLLKLLFSRTLINILLVLVQIAAIVWIFLTVQKYWQGVWLGMNLFSVAVIIYIFNEDNNPAFKLAWAIPICVMPVFGMLAYVFYKTNLGARRLRARVNFTKEATKEFLMQDEEVTRQMEEDFNPICDLSYYLRTINDMPTYVNTEVTYFPLGDHLLPDMLKALEKAEHFIFLEYFIIDKGVCWDRILDILSRKVKEGVEVRVMYDGMCALAKLPYRYPRELQKRGIKAKMFSPIIPMLSSHHNSRDHRKLMIIDGKVGYNGGINLADEYFNEVTHFGHWKDTAVKLEGDAVRSMTAMFLQLWNLSEKGSEDYAQYLLVDSSPVDYKDTGFVIPYYDDPVNDEDVAENVYLDILSKAKRYVHIMTPYFIVDHEMESALVFAAKRGVDVKLMIPHIPDKKLTFDIARTYYPHLLKAGVQVYEYTPGFVHAKQFVSDDERAVVGSINLDFRSLFEHFESATFLYKNAAVFDIEKDYQETLKQCTEVTMEYYKAIPFYRRLRGRVFKMFGNFL